MDPENWLHLLAAEIVMAPGFVAALDQQLRHHAQTLLGADGIGNGEYALLPPDEGFAVQFRTTATGVIGVIEGMLVDPSSSGHRVTLGWRARGAADQPIRPDQERDDLEFFWVEFPIDDLSADTEVDTRAAAAAVTASFPVDWDVHDWEGGVWLTLHAHRPFAIVELGAMNLEVARVVNDWSTRDINGIDYVSEPEVAPDRVTVRWYLDGGVSIADVLVAMLNALGGLPAASAVARCSVGRKR